QHPRHRRCGGGAAASLRGRHTRQGAPLSQLPDRHLRPRDRHGAGKAVALRRGPTERASRRVAGGRRGCVPVAQPARRSRVAISMAVLPRGVLATILVIGLTMGATPAVAQEDLSDDPAIDAWQTSDDGDAAPPITPADYENALAPYGQWVDDSNYGQVWRPEVAYGWRPYVDGYWAWTPYGWTWVSSEPSAWTLHYGRWGFVTALGWAWVPGSVWGPAWVDWFWGDGFVGWAPLAPFGAQVVIDQFVFVHAADFCHPHLATVVVDHRLVPDPVIHD